MNEQELTDKLVNDVYAETSGSQARIRRTVDYLIRHGWVQDPDSEAQSKSAEAAALRDAADSLDALEGFAEKEGAYSDQQAWEFASEYPATWLRQRANEIDPPPNERGADRARAQGGPAEHRRDRGLG